MKHPVTIAILVAAIAGCSLATPPPAPDTAPIGVVPLFEGLGTNGRRITTASPQAQRYFDQGLSFLFAFNHDEAIRSFRRAAELDPSAAMAWWGIAVAQGPHINNPAVTPAAAEAAWRALQRAQRAASDATETERSLISALASRYADPAPADRTALDQAYAAAMREVWRLHRGDADVGALFAEALMDLRPWDQWTPQGKPQPGTDEVLATLQDVMKLRANHPLALHLYIHAVEASTDPGRADAAADRLRDLQPGLGHLVHMPSHIDVRRGRWREAIAANTKAIQADRRYLELAPRQGFYGLYMAHNHHMLAYGAMMIGRRAEAVSTIDAMIAEMPPEWIRQFTPIADGYLAMPLEVRVRFGAWDEILAAPQLPERFTLARALRHYARGVALAAKGNTAAARAEQAEFAAARKIVPADAMFGNNSASDLLALAGQILEGELAYREGRRDNALASLRRAVELQDELRYDEPPAWIIPARHTLGAVLLDAKRANEAEQVFRADLHRLPENGWALFGLARSLRMQRKDAEAAKLEARLRRAWSGADTDISSPCACLAGS